MVDSGLCGNCAHVRTVPTKIPGRTFYRCARAASDPRFAKYPSLPVARCAGHEPRDEVECSSTATSPTR